MKGKKFVKIAAGVMAAAMVVLAFASCGNSDKSEKSGEDVKLVWYFYGEPSKPDNDEVYAEANKLIKDKLGYTVDFKVLDNASYDDKMKMIVASGEEYDICWTSNWKNDYLQNVSNGAFLAIDDYLKEVPDLKKSIDDKIWEGMKIGGKIYGVPNQQIMARQTAIVIPEETYGKYEKYFNGIKKYEDLTPYMEAYSKEVPETAWAQLFWQDTCYMYGIENILTTDMPVCTYLDGDGKIEVFNLFESDVWKNLIAAKEDWRNKKYTTQATKPKASPGSYLAEELPFQITTYKPGMDIEKGKQTGYPVKSFTASDSYLTKHGITATIQALNVDTKQPVEALKFLEYINTDSQIANLLCYGIEGKHYEKIGDNKIKITNESGFKINSWEMCNVFNIYLLDGQDDNTWTDTKKINDEAKPSRLLGFNADTDKIKLEINNCKSVITEYLGLIEQGNNSVKNNEIMCEKLKQAGIDKIIEEVQKQIDEWQANK